MKPEPISVTQLNKYMKNKVDQDEYLNNVLVKGEISNFKHHYTGHMYFTLKDDNSLIKCIMFKGNTSHLNFVPKDGMSVIILGTVSVFERDGVYQIYCKAMQEDGLGNLYNEFEKLKQKLEQEGLFDQKNKKKIPLYPKVIGVLTSRDRLSNKRYNKCIYEKKSKCIYKIIASTSTRRRSSYKNCRCNQHYERKKISRCNNNCKRRRFFRRLMAI